MQRRGLCFHYFCTSGTILTSLRGIFNLNIVIWSDISRSLECELALAGLVHVRAIDVCSGEMEWVVWNVGLMLLVEPRLVVAY